jgi:hypothetical protein
MLTALFFYPFVVLKFLGIAQVFVTGRASSAVHAKVCCGLDQFFKCFCVGFDKALFLEGAEGFFIGVVHFRLLFISFLSHWLKVGVSSSDPFIRTAGRQDRSSGIAYDPDALE